MKVLKRILFPIISNNRAMAIDIGGMRKPYLKEEQAFDTKDLVARVGFI